MKQERFQRNQLPADKPAENFGNRGCKEHQDLFQCSPEAMPKAEQDHLEPACGLECPVRRLLAGSGLDNGLQLGVESLGA